MLVGAFASQPVKVACVGNSITYGLTLDDPATQSYPARLQQMLGDGYVVGNFGKPGATLLRHGHRPYNEQEEYRQALDFAGDIVVIHLGVNDTDPRNWPHYTNEFVRDYLMLIDSLRSVNPEARFFIARLSPISDRHPRFGSGTRDWRGQIQELIENIAEISGATLIDFERPLLANPFLIPDGLHPNAEGAALLAETVYSAITGDFGGLKMPMVYTDHIVLPFGKSFSIHGTADAGKKVRVEIGRQVHNAVASPTGDWEVTLLPLTSTSPYTMTVSDGDTTLTFRDILAGRVWLCSGQSNMEFTLSQSSTGEEDIPHALNDKLRFFDMKARWRTDDVEWDEGSLDSINHLKHFVPTAWTTCTPETAARFSAIGYYFGKELQDSLRLPIGLICNAVGGSTTGAWIDRTTIEYDFPEILAEQGRSDYTQPWARERIARNIAKSSDKLQRHPYQPAYLFETGIMPLESFPIDGVIWYQGESNTHNIEAHSRLFPMLVKSWNKNWGTLRGLPFLFVQLSSLNRPSWPEFRWSQATLADKLQGQGYLVDMVVSSDLGSEEEVHPAVKKPIGHRLAAKALRNVYGLPVNSLTPLPAFARIEADSITFTSNYSTTAGMDVGLVTTDGHAPSSFEVAEFKGYFFPAKAVMRPDGQVRIAIPDEVENPRYIRYAWEPYTEANVASADGFPMSTFLIPIENAGFKLPSVEVTEMPRIKGDKDYAKGVSAAFAGRCGPNTIVAGGANFPGKPAAKGGSKKFYDNIYRLEDGAGKWVFAGRLPSPTAYGASVTTDMGLICIGGSTPDGPTADVFVLSLGSDGMAEFSLLPSLPSPMEQIAATAYGTVLTVYGADGAGKASFHQLDLINPQTGWTTDTLDFDALPYQATLTSAYNEAGWEVMCLTGGYRPRTDAQPALINCDMRIFPRLNPSGDFLDSFTPQAMQGLFAPAGQTATLLSPERIIFTGGVNPQVFSDALNHPAPDYLSHPASWYRFSDEVIVYNVRYDKAVSLGHVPAAARAGAMAVRLDDSSILLINGETQPGIRTPSVIRLTLTE